jgi:glycerol-3-phosphate acyltransferase PlsY
MSPVAIGVLRVLGPIVLGYLLGGIPFGVMITRVFFKADITALGSGNTGGTNVYRNFGWGPAIAVGLLDVAKAAVPTLVGFMLADPAWGPDARDWVAIAAGLAAAAGHSYSPYFRLRGGKAVSSAAGIVAVLMPLNILVLLPFFALMVTIFRIVSVSSMLTALALPFVTMTLYPGRTPLLVASVVALVFVVWRHRTNIARLMKGEEPRIGRGGAALRARLERTVEPPESTSGESPETTSSEAPAAAPAAASDPEDGK